MRVAGRSGARPADRADLVAGLEAVPVVAVGRELVELDADAVRLVRHGGGRPLAEDVAEVLVAGDLVADLERLGRQAAADHERVGREPRPQDEAFGRRVAGRDAERERVAAEARLRERAIARESGQRDPGGERPAGLEQRPAADPPVPVARDGQGRAPCCRGREPGESLGARDVPATSPQGMKTVTPQPGGHGGQNGPMRKIDAFAHILPPGYLAAPGAPPRLDDEAGTGCGTTRRASSASTRSSATSTRRFRVHGPARRLRADPRAGRPAAGGGGPAAGRRRAGAARQRGDGRAGAALSPTGSRDSRRPCRWATSRRRSARSTSRSAQLGAVGVQFFSNVRGVPLDDPRFDPLLARMEELDRMIWLHPTRDAAWPDYATERESDFGIWWSLGWPYETAAALARLVYSGQMDRHPRLRVIAHHGGGMVPQFPARLAMGPGYRQTKDALPLPALDYFHRFYADTALFGAPHAVSLRHRVLRPGARAVRHRHAPGTALHHRRHHRRPRRRRVCRRRSWPPSTPEMRSASSACGEHAG